MARVKDTIDKMQTHPGAFSIAVLALEGFNEITPPLARAARSALIHLCAERLRKALRSVDLAVQFKDGTFGLLLAGVRSNQARAVVQRVATQVLEGNLDHPKGDVTFRLRAGIATYPDGGASAERLLRRATTALFISQIEGAMGASRTPPAEFSVAVLSLEGGEKDHESHRGVARGFPLFVQRLEGTLRAVDVATQLDDRKYGVLLMGVNHAQASAIVERIRDQILKDNLGLPTKEVTFRLRAGIATYPEAGPLADGLLYHAESSLTFLAP
jgi:diguanylate cyclase (GGDEF)-like protein